MRLELRPGEIRVYLSERNLKALLAKVEGFPSNSKRTIFWETAETPTLYVTAEPDAVHYAHPSRKGLPPGPMILETERRMRRR